MIGQQFGNYRVLSLWAREAWAPCTSRSTPASAGASPSRCCTAVLGRRAAAGPPAERGARRERHPRPEHHRDPRFRHARGRRAVPRHGAARGRELPASASAARGRCPWRTDARVRAADGVGAGRRAQEGHRPPGPQARQPVHRAPSAATSRRASTPTSSSERMKVLDFGIAKGKTLQPGDSVKTRTGIAYAARLSTCRPSSAAARRRSTTAATCTRWASSSTRCSLWGSLLRFGRLRRARQHAPQRAAAVGAPRAARGERAARRHHPQVMFAKNP